jgi:phosphoribosylformylglycinamidine synthase
VQRGDAPTERNLLRLFRRPEVTKLIKKSNDFGAGGVSVAIGELTDGLDIYLDRVPLKYPGLNSTEIAISESQERMAVVIEANDKTKFEQFCAEENIEVTHIADVTDTHRMRMYNNGKLVVELCRDFIDRAGAKHFAKATIGKTEEKNPFLRHIEGTNIEEKMLNNLSDDNVLLQKGLIEMFDSTAGATTVLMPFGGKTQRTETQVSVQKIPVEKGYTDTASMMAFGYNPFISEWSPYHGAAYAVVEAVSKVVAAGANFENMRFSYQEYFEKMTDDPHTWGKPLSALLGTLKMQVELGLPSIGGKDSMSGTYKHINVPPTLVAFGITTVDAGKVISPELKKPGNYVYFVKHNPLENYMPDTAQLKKNWNFVTENISNGKILSAYAIGFGGVGEALAKMAFGNTIGATIEIGNDLFDYSYGSIVIETNEKLEFENAIHIGNTTENETLMINGNEISLEKLYKFNTEKFAAIYPISTGVSTSLNDRATTVNADTERSRSARIYTETTIEKPIVYIPIFPGTTDEYETAKAFERAGAEVVSTVFCNLKNDDISRSIEQMKEHIAKCHIFVLCGGSVTGDEPDGSAKFIVNVLNNPIIADEIHNLIERSGLILGICNGFQALVKSGLLPYGKLGMVTKNSPTLFKNDINRHVSQIVKTRVSSVNSPWLAGFNLDDEHSVAVSHSEGKFVVTKELAQEFFANGQVAFQYVDGDNPNGSMYDIEGLISQNGQILGKMGHSERYENNLFKNINGNKNQDIFKNAVRYFDDLHTGVRN